MLPQAHAHDEPEAEDRSGQELQRAAAQEGADPEGEGSWGLVAEFADPSALKSACAKVREAGYKVWDAHTPFPVHGLERAMGLRRSLVPYAVLVLGLGGAAAGMLLQWWVSVEAYPLVISGKPFFSWPAFVPIMFECGVLGGALGAILGFLHFSRLPRHNHALFESERFEGVSDDKFFISIESEDPQFDRRTTTAFLKKTGATYVEAVPEPA
ncbi:MAG TPA: DUF3341 domain-containing protein [Acidobacteriota bacterium]|nr:DUF3341 domain-containing protein [Acidobacteriota bacterium]